MDAGFLASLAPVYDAYLDAQEALALGLVDAVCPAGELLERARQSALAGAEPRRTTRRTDVRPTGDFTIPT